MVEHEAKTADLVDQVVEVVTLVGLEVLELQAKAMLEVPHQEETQTMAGT